MLTTEQLSVAAVLVVSILVQAAAAIMVFRLIAITGYRLAWSFVAVALALMAIRRLVPLVRLVTHPRPQSADLLNELIALSISVLMLVGLAGIAPMFRERIRLHNALLDREQRLRNLVEESPVAMLVTSEKGDQIQLVNRRFTRLFGYNVEEIPDVGSWWALACPDGAYRATVRNACEERIAQSQRAQGSAGSLEATVRCKDGSVRDVDVRVSALGESRVIIFVDVTGRKQAEAALRESEERYRLLHENAGVGIGYYTTDGKVISYNRVAANNMGGKAEDFAGKHLSEIFPEPEASKYNARLQHAAASASPQEYDDLLVLPTGNRWFSSVFARICNIRGDVVGIQIISKDETERLRAETELRRHREHLEELVAARTAALEAANHDLESFSYSVSHDLRAPLRAVDGFAAMLARRCEANLDAEGTRLLGLVRDGASRMGRLIEDMLTFSRTGLTEIRKLPVNMTAVVREAWEGLEPMRAGRQIRFELCAIPDTQGDPAMLRQVWANLLGNAIKFTQTKEDASIVVSGERLGAECVYWVRDNGVGFDPAYAGKLFGVFQRLHPAHEFEGSGIGLAIVKSIVSRHGGRIGAESTLGQGAVFRFALPTPEASRALSG